MTNRSEISTIDRGACKAQPAAARILGGLLLLTCP